MFDAWSTSAVRRRCSGRSRNRWSLTYCWQRLSCGWCSRRSQKHMIHVMELVRADPGRGSACGSAHCSFFHAFVRSRIGGLVRAPLPSVCPARLTRRRPDGNDPLVLEPPNQDDMRLQPSWPKCKHGHTDRCSPRLLALQMFVIDATAPTPLSRKMAKFGLLAVACVVVVALP